MSHNVSPALAITEAGGSIRQDEAAADITNFSVINFSVMGLFVAWGLGAGWKPVQTSGL
jgi:hypothetical protein